ncbi:MAG: hypothetical protein HOP18_27245 [Deltaproteobacteria bacterium]|nr:hypothetical protein [Deltaproteobacteria bacterium]
MRPSVRTLTFLVVPLAGLLAWTSPVLAHDNEEQYARPHSQVHNDLNEGHEAAHHYLGARHDAAHEYSMTRRQHRRLHRSLKRDHRDTHSDLRDQHEDHHDRSSYQGGHRNYGRGDQGGRYRQDWR